MLTPFERGDFPPHLQWLKMGGDVWMNNRYQVVMRRAYRLVDLRSISTGEADDGKRCVIHLSIKRRDKKPIRSWRDLLWIKNQLCGDECEAVEVFPPMSVLVDTSNQYHLWVLPAGVRIGFDLGNAEPVVHAGDGHTGPGQARQQPLPDWYPPSLSNLRKENTDG